MLAFFQELNLDLFKFDELLSLISGIQYVIQSDPTNEVYFYENPLDESAVKRPFQIDKEMPYPYMVVNIGSGVSVLSVRGPGEIKRITGTRYRARALFSLGHPLCQTLLEIFRGSKS